jgi:hypothetical protein
MCDEGYQAVDDYCSDYLLSDSDCMFSLNLNYDIVVLMYYSIWLLQGKDYPEVLVFVPPIIKAPWTCNNCEYSNTIDQYYDCIYCGLPNPLWAEIAGARHQLWLQREQHDRIRQMWEKKKSKIKKNLGAAGV